MSALSGNGADLTNLSAKRADELFQKHQDEIYRDTDKLLARLMLFQWVAGVVIAFFVSPYTWAGQSKSIHIHIWSAVFLGGAITVFPVLLTRLWPGRAITRYVIAVAQMLMSALLIDVTGGRIETHFHVFGSLVILSFYRDWRVLIPATVVVALDHFLRGVYWPYSVYGVLAASPWRSMEHAGWVIFEDVFLVISCRRSILEMRSIAKRTAALETSEQNFRRIFEEAPIGMAVVGLDEKFIRVNAKLCEMVDYTEAELQTRTPLDLTHLEDVASSRHLVQDMLRGGRHNHLEKRYLRRDGAAVWASRTGSVIRDQEGNPGHFLIMIENISERRRAENALKESTRQLEAALHANELVMDNSQDVICTIDHAGRFVTTNAACEHLWGYTPAELIGRNYADLVHPDDRLKTVEADATARRKGKITDFVNRYIRKDGTLVDVLWSASWSEADGSFFCVAHDVTERQRIEKQLREAKEEADRANRAKSEFLSRMSHELRTPLNAILGFGQLLEKQKPTPTQQNRLTYILKAGRHLLDLINEVLDISRIEAGRLQLSTEPVCIDDAIAEAADLIRPLAAERSIHLSVSETLQPKEHVLADKQRLKQVLLNLLTNGVKYTPAGGSVSIRCQSPSPEKIRFLIQDTGPGIPDEKLSRLFTPFDRLGAEQSEVQGTGLGLALSKRLIEEMNGSIGVETSPGHGSIFWIELSRTASPSEILALRQNAGGDRHLRLNGQTRRTFLYIEDNLSNLTLIEHILEEDTHVELLTAMQGKVGLDLARQHLPDLILLDLHLPDLPGWEVLAELQKDEATRSIPTVVISADATKRQTDRLLAAGATDYLTKPIDIDQFRRVLEQTAIARRDNECRSPVA